jgi:hypothetical protein
MTKISRFRFRDYLKTVGLLGPLADHTAGSNSLFRFQLDAIADLTTRLRA